MKLSTFNCRGLGNRSKLRLVLHWLQKKHNGVIFLQETHTTYANESYWKSMWKGQIEFCHGLSSARGVAILIPNHLDIIINEVIKDNTGRFLLLKASFENQPLILANVYVPTKDQQNLQLEFLRFISERLNEFKDDNLILGGDFNIIFDPILDKKGGRVEKKSKAACQLLELMENYNLIDIFRLINPDVKRFTRREMSRCGLVQSRLDYWLISNHILYDFNSQNVLPGMRSDHSIVELELNIQNSHQKGRGFFKFNAALLKDQVYINEIKRIIQNFMEIHSNEQNHGLKWDALKSQIRGFSIAYSSAKRKKNTNDEIALNKKLKEIESKIDDNNFEEYKTIKKELEQIINERAIGIQIRSKAKLIENNEKNLGLLMKEEKKNYNNRYIRALYNSNDELITDPNDILEEQKLYYQKLYSRPEDEFVYQNNIDNVNALNNVQKESCDIPITIHELGKALKELGNLKSPGTDGLTTEFYKFFWVDIKELVYNSLIYAYEHNSLSIEQKRGILTLIPKKDKDSRWLKNWRPLTLLNTDYKILTKLLAMRMQNILKYIINSDQSGYIKGRFIGENIRNIYDVIELAKQRSLPGMIVALDFEKAFDSVSWDFLFKALDAFNFGNYFKKWIRIIYSNPECCTTNNGFNSDFFKISRGIRQGCPISALLFLLVVEIMANNIRQSDNIKGITYAPNKSIVISQLADDTTLFLKDIESLKNALALIDNFSKISGLKLNKDKCEAFWIGSSANSNSKPLGLKWTKGMIKCLGIWCGSNIDDAINFNFNEKIDKIKTLLNIWKQHRLSLKGKITVIKTFAMPLILYPANCLYVPDWVTKQVDEIFVKYLWSGKPPKVKKTTIINYIERGGLKMPLLSAMIKGLKCTWIKRFLSPTFSKLDLLNNFVHYKGKTFKEIVLSKLDTRYIQFDSLFYQQVLLGWFSLFSKHPNNIIDIANSKIWNNKHILINNSPVEYTNWHNNGIAKFYHILDENGHIIDKNNLETKYSVSINQMEYNSLIHAIPSMWKKKVLGKNLVNLVQDDDFVTINDKRVNISKITCKSVYLDEIANIITHPTAQFKWEEKLNLNLEWEYHYKIAFETCCESFVQSFQYKILNRFFPCNYYLSIIIRDQTPLCGRCNETDSLEHYFYYCTDVNNFWISINRWMKSILETTFELNLINILFGIPNYENENLIHFVNYCILYGKLFIYLCMKDDKKICFLDYIVFLKEKMLVEKHINHKYDEYYDLF